MQFSKCIIKWKQMSMDTVKLQKKPNYKHYKSSLLTLLIYPKCAELWVNYFYNDRMNTFIHCWFSIWWISMGALIISDYF